MENDKDIVAALAHDVEKGFRLLMTRYKEPVYWHIRRMVVLHDDAQDATQETFIRIYRSFASYRGDCTLRSWIYRIATNEALRIIGRRKTDEVSMEQESDAAEQVPADSYVDYSDALALRFQQAVLSLPRMQQLVFNLRYYDELPFEEIAQVADTTNASAKASYHKAKEKIVNYMYEHD